LQGSAIFSNFLPLKKALSELETGKTVIIDLSDGFLIDHTVMEFLHDFSHAYEAGGGTCQQHGAPIIPYSDHALAARIMSGKTF
jgi:MFS superfamily sulfate permease-like transporter